jgi:integrase
MRRLRGSIQRLDRDRWRVFATVHDDEGRSRRVSKTVAGSRADAERALESMLGQDGLKSDRRFSEVVDAYLDHAQARVDAGTMAASTLDGYRRKLAKSILPGLGRRMVSEVTPAVVERFMGSQRRDRPGTWRVLRVVLNWAYRYGYVPERVCDRVEPIRQETGVVQPLDVYTAEEAATVLDHPMDGRLKTAVVIALSCGLRRGEICGLEWGDYDGRTIHVRRAWGKDTPKTPGSAAVLAVPAWARDWLDPIRGEGPVVGMSPNQLTEAWRRLWFTWSHEPRPDAPPVRYIPFKNLRHTSLSMVYNETGDIKATSKRGRHASTYITERFYVRPSEAVDEKCADALDRAMGGYRVSR